MNETKEEGVVTILREGELIGLIYRDEKSKHRIMYKCEPMSEEEMRETIEGKVEKPIKKAE